MTLALEVANTGGGNQFLEETNLLDQRSEVISYRKSSQTSPKQGQVPQLSVPRPMNLHFITD